jgi:Zn-finger nucleic acid-binding protein
MNCPACGQPQVIVEHDGVELDLCLAGCGVWFDAQELGMLLGDGAVAIERDLAGLPSSGRGRPCPRCDRAMVLMAAPGSAGVILDCCPRGHGLWFDDGELERMLHGAAGAERVALARVADFLSRFRAARSGA